MLTSYGTEVDRSTLPDHHLHATLLGDLAKLVERHKALGYEVSLTTFDHDGLIGVWVRPLDSTVDYMISDTGDSKDLAAQPREDAETLWPVNLPDEPDSQQTTG